MSYSHQVVSGSPVWAVSLHYSGMGRSDKVYHMQVLPSVEFTGVWTLHAQYGRRDGHLTHRVIEKDVPLATAYAAFDKMLESKKRSPGYRETSLQDMSARAKAFAVSKTPAAAPKPRALPTWPYWKEDCQAAADDLGILLTKEDWVTPLPGLVLFADLAQCHQDGLRGAAETFQTLTWNHAATAGFSPECVAWLTSELSQEDLELALSYAKYRSSLLLGPLA